MPYDQRNDRGGNYDDRRAPRNFQNQFPNSGSLHMREKRSQNAPDMGGDFTITGEVLDYVLREAQNGNEVKLEVSAWKRLSRNNTTFMSLAINIPYSVRQQQQNPGYRQTGYGGGRSGQSVPDRRSQQQMPFFDEPREQRRGGYAEQSQGGRYRVDQVPRDEPSFMRDDNQRERGGFDRDLNDEIPF